MQRIQVPQFSSIHPWYILWMLCGQYRCDLLLSCLYNGKPTSPMHSLMNWEGCQHIYGWLELMVHHTLSKVRSRSVPVFIHRHMVYHWSVVWPVIMLSPWLVACIWCLNLTYEHIDELRGVSTHVWMVRAHGISSTHVWMVGAHGRSPSENHFRSL